jgi:hypothetical protein
MFVDSLLRKLFGKQEGQKLGNAIGVLAGVAGLVASIVSHDRWFGVLAGLVVLISGADLLRERQQRADPSDDHRLVGELVSNPPHLNPLHHQPLPPLPRAPEDRPK